VTSKNNNKLVIAYAGLLADMECSSETPAGSFSLSWLRTFRNNNIRAETRSGKFLIEAVRILAKEDANLSEKLSVQLWGKIGKNQQQLVKKYGIETIIEISEKLPHQESRDKLSRADVLFLPLESEKEGQRPLNIPGKLYDYLEFEKPILALCENSDCREIIEGSGLGIFASPDQPEEIAKTISELIRKKNELPNTYQPNKVWIEKNYSARALSEKLAGIVKRLVT